MPFLIFTTLLWAFSFSLIGEFLAGQVDSYFSVLCRVILAGLVFIPVLKLSASTPKLRLKLMGIGAIQLGLMYLFYYQSFTLLSVPEVLLFTILTPLYVTLISDLIDGRFHPIYLATSLCAIAGAFIIRSNDISSDYLVGFAVVQGANFCFAFGQVSYAKLKKQNNFDERANFFWFYAGAAVIALPAFTLLGGDKIQVDIHQTIVLLWLGVVASGLGYFLWNHGATLVDSGSLAIMNNLLIPAGLIVNLLIWQTPIDIERWAIGGSIIIGSLIIHRKIINKSLS